MYITSIASNESFKFRLNKKKIIFFFILNVSLLFFLYIFTPNFFINKIINTENIKILEFINLHYENTLILNKLFNFPINFITIILVNYLFLTLIATVKITNIFEGPIRTKN